MGIKSKFLLFSPVIPLLVFGFFGFRFNKELFRSGVISGGESRTLAEDFFVHLSSRYFIDVKGRIFSDVRGMEPFYLALPQIHSILFVTGKVDRFGCVHVYDLVNDRDIKSETSDYNVGWSIGLEESTNKIRSEYVSRATSNEVILVEQYSNSKKEIIIKLNN